METPRTNTRSRTLVGAVLLLAMCVVIVLPVWLDTLSYVHLSAALILGVVGGLMIDPQTFRDIAKDLIDNLPGGQK